MMTRSGRLAMGLMIVIACGQAVPARASRPSTDNGMSAAEGKDVGEDREGGARRVLQNRQLPSALAKEIEARIRAEIAADMEQAQQQADFGRDCSRTVPGKDIIDAGAPDGGDLSMGAGLTLDACCRTCNDLSGLGCKAVVWNTGMDCFFKTIDGPLVDPGLGTAHENGDVTAAFP